MKRLLSTALALIISAFCIMPVCAAVQNDAEVIRVGWYPIETLEEYDPNGSPSGYGYDVLETLSRYTGFTYEFVSGSFDECLERLKNGEVDLMLFMKYTPEREEVIDYCDYPLFKISTSVTCLAENAGEYYGEESFNGKIVALETGSVQENELNKFISDDSIHYTPLYCADSAEVRNAVDNGMADFAVFPSVIALSDKQTTVDSFNQRYACITLNKHKPELLNTVNRGMSSIMDVNPEYFDNLYEIYYGDYLSQTFFLTNEEKAAIDELGALRFFNNTENGYLSRWDNGEFRGIRTDIIEAVAEKLGVDYEFVPIDSINELSNWQDDQAADFIGGAYFDYTIAEKYGYQITSPILTYKYYCIKNKNYTGSQEDAKVAALSPGDYFTDRYIVPNYSEEQIVGTESMLKCLELVNSGTADITYLSSYMAEYYLQSYEYNNVTSSLTDYSTQACFAGKGDIDPLIISAMNKAIGSITHTEMETIVLQNTVEDKTNLSIRGAVNKHPLEFFAAIAVLLAVVIATTMLMIFNRKLNSNNQKLIQANAAKSDFLSRMSHDIRTPLNAVLGFAALAEDEPDVSPQMAEYLSGIDESGKYLLGLINDVLDMSKIEASKLTLIPEPYRYEEFKNTIVAIVASRAQEKGVRFIMKNEVTEGETVEFDKLRIQQVFINLLNNAVKFTPEGGEVEFRVVSGEPTEDGRLPLTFTVRDNGIGMSEEFLKNKLFQSFEQERMEQYQAYSGTGLGLTIAKRLVEQMNGTIECESELGKGTVFTVKLCPKLAEGVEDGAPRPAVSLDILHGAHILLCEDNHLNAIIAGKLLEKAGCTVDVAESGKRGVERFAASEPRTYSAILMDIRMPEMDGLEAARVIRGLFRPDALTVPIIAMSANALSEDVHESMAAGMNAHLSKPVEPGRLYEVLAEQISREQESR